MISVSYCNYRDSPSSRQSRYISRSASSPSNSNLKSSSSSKGKKLNITGRIFKARSASSNQTTLADFLAYKNEDANAQRVWELPNPNDKPMNHRPTSVAIKSSIMLALGSSIYSIFAQRYRQNDHAHKTWTDLRMDIESIIKTTSPAPHATR